MTPREKQLHLINRYEILPGPQERLNAMVEKYGRLSPLREEERIEVNRVHGCQSKVYFVGTLENGLCHFRSESESVLVKGLVALICDIYDGGTPAEVIEVEPEILQRLGIWQILSPTRQNGLTDLRRVIRDWAIKVIEI